MKRKTSGPSWAFRNGGKIAVAEDAAPVDVADVVDMVLVVDVADR